MDGYAEAKAARPIRHLIALSVYRALWWPAVALAVPFVLIGAFVEWLEEEALPAISEVFRPLWAAYHRLALSIGNAILGDQPKDRTNDE